MYSLYSYVQKCFHTKQVEGESNCLLTIAHQLYSYVFLIKPLFVIRYLTPRNNQQLATVVKIYQSYPQKWKHENNINPLDDGWVPAN